jgi:gamma-glutamyltranspeptidase/glutathione hydrolase
LTTHGGAVACADRLAATIGAQILARGGNAVDAAVGTALALAVTWPSAGNLGGGGVMIIAMADGTQVTVDARETAPAAFLEDAFLDEEGNYVPSRATDPWLCIGVPGSVAGLALAHERFGTLPWHELVAPAILLAQQGFDRGEMFHRILSSSATALSEVPSSREVFLNPDGSVPAVGTRLKQPALARTLEQLAADGPESFYRGPIAKALAADVQASGGLLTYEDLASYHAVFRPPLALEIAGTEILAMPPPSSGGVAIGQILGQLERHGALDGDPGSVEFLHLYAESARRAYAERARWLGDPNYVEVPTEWLLAPETINDLAASIDPDQATASTSIGPPVERLQKVPDKKQTTHLSVIDGDGNAVSFTTTLEATYGSKAVSRSTGILLNNELRDFNRIPGKSTEAGHIGTAANLAAPGKRPLTSMSPIIVLEDNEVVLVTGSPGGRTIINTVCQIFLGFVGRRLSLSDAVAAPRVHHQWFPDQLVFEPGFPSSAVRKELIKRGHTVVNRENAPPAGGSLGSAHSVSRDPRTGIVTAVGDPRRDGWSATDS